MFLHLIKTSIIRHALVVLLTVVTAPNPHIATPKTVNISLFSYGINHVLWYNSADVLADPGSSNTRKTDINSLLI